MSGRNIVISENIFSLPSNLHNPIIDQFLSKGYSKAISQLDRF
jgi:hypothetical protein